MARKLKKLKYLGTEYEVKSSYEFADRTFYRVVGLQYPISENAIDKEPVLLDELTE